VEPGPAVGLSADVARALADQRRELEWLRNLRLAALQAFQRYPMPTPTTEGWRRTDIRGLRLDAATPFADPLPAVASARELPALPRASLKAAEDLPGILVQHDTSTTFRQCTDELRRQGVLLLDLGEAAREHPELVRLYLGTVVPPDEAKFSALQLAFMNAGVFAYVPRDVCVKVPLHVINYFNRQNLAAFTRVLLVADQGAEVTLVDEYLSGDRQGQAVASGVVEVVARPNARVRYVQLQQWGPEQWAFSTMRARVERDAMVSWLAVALGGHLTRASVESRLVGQGSETELIGLIFGDGQQHYDYYSLQSHEGSRSRSSLVFKAVLRDQASSNYTGMVHIAHEARQCDATQESRNLLLSHGAKADADPRLEILNSDVVRATHGASVGPVDQEMLYYVMTRGLSRREAERLLVQAFFEPILAGVPIESLRKRLWLSIDERLGAAEPDQAA
jgi:Fe-S cluster assembly protein SufD